MPLLRVHGLGPPSGSVNWKRRELDIIRLHPCGAPEGAPREWLAGGVKNGPTHAVTAFNDLRASGVLEFNGT
jgi:hypothetical protein